jgi:endonuclease/exonuclease/phosphatase family metal-dependent hydrolase
MKFASILFFALTTLSQAVEFRAATFNIGANFTAEGFPDYSLGDPGTSDHDSVKAVLGRINADVVALQEIAPLDVSGNPDDLDALALALGYPNVYLAPVSDALPLKGPIDTSLRVIFLSRFPFLATTSIRSPAGAKEITRLLPSVKIDVPGTTRDPLLIAGHLKSGTATADRFRRAVEMRRLTEDLSTRGLTENDNFIIMGDFNLSSTNTTFTTLPPGLPASYVLGTDVTLPLTYSTNPLAYFTYPGVARLDPRQLNNSKVTFPTSGSVIDLFLVSPAFAGRPMGLEIYNSALDTSNLAGLPKAGSPLASATSAAASDHLLLFGDFELDADFPNLDVALSVPIVAEDAADGSAMFTVTLPATRATSLTVTVTSDDPSVVTASSELTVPAGSLAASTAVRTVRNFIEEADRSVTFTASAIGYDPDSGVLQVNDADGPYVFAAPGQTLSEAFTGFDGAYDPAPWVTTGGVWQGVDDGSSGTSGLRSYGPAGDGSIGASTDAGAVVATADFTNLSATVLTALQVSFTAEQWKAAFGGRADTLAVDLVINGVPTPLPALSFSADTSLPTGAVAGGTSVAKNAVVTGLAIAPGASFTLRFTITPGPGGGALPADVFLNEFHYDNDGADANEFIEIVVGPGYSGSLSSINVVLYNGDDAANVVVYNTLNLGTAFGLAGTYNGYRVFTVTLPVDGLQNGSHDGFAIVNTATSQVLHLLSYEGVFTAASGPAAGLTSTSVGIAESGTTPPGSSLGLTGSGGASANFTWATSAGSNTKGAPNSGQSFVNPVLPPQGIAIDNLSVTFLVDTDGDGLPDITDLDDDNDSISDADEFVFGTNPLDASSRYSMSLTYPSSAPGMVGLSFPTALGRTYTVESSPNLSSWSAVGSYAGTGNLRVVDVAVVLVDQQKFYRIRATLP